MELPKFHALRGISSLLFLLPVLLGGCTQKAKIERYSRRGDEYFQQGHYDEARLEYLNLLRLDRGNLKGITRMGEMWFASGDPLEAIRYLSAAKDLLPEDASIRAKVAVSLFGIGHRMEARKEALTTLKLAPTNDEALLVLADMAQTASEVDAARQQIEACKSPDRAAVHLATATLFLKKGDAANVQKELESALALDPKSYLGHLALGNLWWSKKDLVRAETEFKAALEFSPPRTVAPLKYADFKYQTEKPAEAKEMVRNVTRQTPDFLPSWMALAQYAYEEKQTKETLDILANVFGRDPNFFQARVLQSSVYLATGEIAKAEEALEALNKQHPGIAPLKFELARAYVENGKINQAAAELNEVVAANPNYIEAILLQAAVNLKLGDAGAAVNSMEGLLKKRPELVQPQVVLVEAYRSLARFDEAAAILEHQSSANPKDSATHFLLGIVQRQKKDLVGARASFEKAHSLAPDNPVFLEQLVDLDIAEKKFDPAHERILAEEKRSPKSARVKLLEAKLAAAQGKWAEAEGVLLETLKLAPDDAAAASFLVPVYVAEKKLPQALEQVERVLQKNPKDPAALKTGALLQDDAKNYTKARDLYERYLALRPDDEPVMNNLAYLYSARLNQLDKAAEIARSAVEKQPHDPSAAETLGWICYRQGEFPQALALIQASASQLGSNGEVQYHLGMANYAMGHLEEARAALQKAADSPDDFPGKAEVTERMALLAEGGSKQSSQSLEALLQKSSDDLLIRTRIAEAQEREGDPAKAAATYETIAQKNPRLLAPLVQLVRLYAGPLKSQEKAMDFGKKAKLLAPNDPTVSAALGKLVYASGNYTWAYSLLQDAAHQKGEDPAILEDLAWASYSVSKVPEAQSLMERVRQKAPQGPQAASAAAFLSMTNALQHPDELASHEAEATDLLKANPAYVPALMLRGALETQRGQAKQAMGTYEEVLRHQPDFAPAQRELASLYFEDPANRAKAGDLATKARNNLPGDPRLSALLGAISYERKEISYAIELLNESARKQPLNAEGLYYLGMAYLQTKDKQKGRDTLDQALKAGLDGARAEQARRAIAASEKS